MPFLSTASVARKAIGTAVGLPLHADCTSEFDILDKVFVV
jgi:hypothetical protein